MLAVRDREARIWDLESEQSLTSPLKHRERILRAAFSPRSDRTLTTTENGDITVWNLSTGHINWTASHPGMILDCAAFSPAENCVAAGGHSSADARSWAQVWDTDSGHALTPMLECEGILKHVAFSPNARHLTTANEQPVGTFLTIWDTQSGRPLAGPHQHHGDVHALQFSPNGRTVYAGVIFAGVHAHAVIACEVDAPDWRQLFPVHGEVTTFAFSPDGNWLAAGTDSGSTSVHDLRTGKTIGPGVKSKNAVRSVAFSPDGRFLLTAGDDLAARLWHVGSGELVQAPFRHESYLRQAAFFEDGRRMVTLAEKTVRVWDLSLAPAVLQSFPHPDPSSLAEVSPDGRFLVAAGERSGHIWDMKSQQRIGEPLTHDHRIRALAISPDSRLLATASEDKTVRIWDVTTGHLAAPALAHGGAVDQVVFHPKKSKLLTASGDSILVWDSASGRPLGPTLDLSNRLTALMWQPGTDACLAAVQAPNDQSDLLTMRTEPALQIHGSKRWPGRIIQFLTRSDRVLLVAKSDALTVRVWDVANGLPVSPPFKYERPVTHVAADVNLTRLALSYEDSSVHIWDLTSGELMGPPITLAYRHSVDRAGFGPDNHVVLTASSDGIVRTWDYGPEQRAISAIEAITSLLSAQEIDGTGATVTLSPSRLAEIWQRLKSTSVWPRAAPPLAAAWHRRQADECEANFRFRWPEDSPAALFHLARAADLEPEAPIDFLRRAVAHAHVKNWDQAKADYERGLAQSQRPDCTVPDHVLLQIIAGDIEGYRNSCARLMTRFGTAEDPRQANDAVWLCCLLPNALPNYDLPVRMMRHAAKQRPHQNNVLNTFGAVLFRAGEFREAIETLHAATRYSPGEGSAFDLILLALAHQGAGDLPEARSYLDHAIRAIDFPDVDWKWRWAVELGLLRKEIEQRMKQP